MLAHIIYYQRIYLKEKPRQEYLCTYHVQSLVKIKNV